MKSRRANNAVQSCFSQLEQEKQAGGPAEKCRSLLDPKEAEVHRVSNRGESTKMEDNRRGGKDEKHSVNSVGAPWGVRRSASGSVGKNNNKRVHQYQNLALPVDVKSEDPFAEMKKRGLHFASSTK